MFFASDNSGPVPQQVLDALSRANDGYAMPYGNDALTDQVTAALREVFEAPEASVYLVGTGTAANALILGTLAQPWDTVFCTQMAHIAQDECNAPEFYMGGAKLTHVSDTHGKMRADALEAAMNAAGASVHNAQRGPVSITSVTELGTVYRLDDIRAVTQVARRHGALTHLDGARLANAVVALGCSPADMTWKAGIDAVSFGGTKNGLMGVEAVIFFDPSHAREFELRRKRGAHLFSKGRFLAAQMQAYLADDLWLTLARQANANGAALAQALTSAGAQIDHPVEANVMFATLPRSTHRRLKSAGAQYYLDGSPEGPDDAGLRARFVCDWSVGRHPGIYRAFVITYTKKPPPEIQRGL